MTLLHHGSAMVFLLDHFKRIYRENSHRIREYFESLMCSRVFLRFALHVMLAGVVYIHCHTSAEREPPGVRAASSD
ncbi:hypothetical protein CA601_08875 [Paraburkholderia hospita]|nr:hypothetical protein CA601_08875 [Paraburkholderia hospita]